SSRSSKLYFYCLTLVNRYPLTRPTHWCKTSQSLLYHSQLLVIMVEDKVIILGPNELPNLYIRTMLKRRKKLSRIEGSGPPRDDSKFEAWDDEDSFIINMATKFYDFGNKPELYIWKNLIETYSIKKDSVAYYDIESKIFNSRQGTLSITEYYGILNRLWIELDQYQGLKMSKTDSIAYTGLIERGRIFKFLHDLNFEYDPIWVQIVGKEKLPSLSASQDTQRLVMLDKGCSNTGSAMVTEKDFTKRSTFEGKLFTKSSHGEYYTPNSDVGEQTTSDKENVIEHPSILQIDQDIQAFSKEEMDRLRALLNSTSKSLVSCGLTMKVSKEQPIIVANGDHVPIVGYGNIQLQSSLSLYNVLHVPKLANNLISIHRLIQD
ncbi:hypothetical protein CR513_35006, partial [Mucuna pruriens]